MVWLWLWCLVIISNDLINLYLILVGWVIISSFKYWKFILAHRWTTLIIISHRWTKHIMFQNQVNRICINLKLALYYICIQIMLQKLACHMAIIQNSGSNYTFMCIKTKSYIYVFPLYIYSSYPPFHCHYQCWLRRSIDLFSDCSLVIPIAEKEG